MKPFLYLLGIFHVVIASFPSFDAGAASIVDIPGEYLPLNFTKNSLFVPSAWQKPNPDGDFDLVVVGGGAAGSYAINRIYDEFSKKNRPMPKIALVERTPMIGGRLQSALGAGALGLGADRKNAVPQEYGGMRVDSINHPLVYKKMIEYGQWMYGNATCKPLGQCEDAFNCCPNLLSPMEVGKIRYASTKNDGSILDSSSIFDQSVSYIPGKGYNLTDIAMGIGSPFDNCAQMVLAASTMAKTNETFASLSWETGVTDLCQNLCREIDGLCALCEKFPGDTKIFGPLSCTGYDDIPPTLASFVNFVDKVININGNTHLFTVRGGYQGFIQGLLYGKGDVPIAPLFEYELHRITAMGRGVSKHVEKHVSDFNRKKKIQKSREKSNCPMSLTFTDGSQLQAKNVLLTMLPFDLSSFRDFESWQLPLEKNTESMGGDKLVLGWNDPSKSPASVLKFDHCASKNGCQRLILDGGLLRQIWLWDEKTILAYDTTQARSKQPSPSTKMMKFASKYGMNKLIERVVDDMRKSGIDVEMPDWARFKSWERHTIEVSWINTPGNITHAYLSRPAGPDLPIFYANSEISPEDSNHGWVEGAFEAVEMILPDLVKSLLD